MAMSGATQTALQWLPSGWWHRNVLQGNLGYAPVKLQLGRARAFCTGSLVVLDSTSAAPMSMIGMRGIIYTRFSPRIRGLDSLEKQAVDCEFWADRYGITIEAVFCEKHASGSLPFHRRSSLREALKWVTDRPGSVFICRNLSRIARDTALALRVERIIFDAGCRLVSVEDGGLQADTPEQRLLRTIKYALHEYQRSEMAERTRRRMLQQQAAGKVCGSIAPWGYRIEQESPPNGPKYLVKDALEQMLIQRALELYHSGKSWTEIARNMPCDHPRKGTPWTREQARFLVISAKKQSDRMRQVPRA